MNIQLVSKLKTFRLTGLYKNIKKQPLGFVDVGSLGGVHSVVNRIADLIHPICFEPDHEGYMRLKEKYRNPRPYSKVTVKKIALAGQTQKSRKLYVSTTPTNTSLIEPNANFISRYRADRFKLSHIINIPTSTLDDVFRKSGYPSRMGEFLKLDTQGSEYEILEGAKSILSRQCVAVFCEVEFFQVYKGQKTLNDITTLLRSFGFSLYGLYPHYRSAKLLDHNEYSTEERLMWGDAVFFKDPLDDLNKSEEFSPRSTAILILCAMATRFYDYALELVNRFISVDQERDLLSKTIKNLAKNDRADLDSQFQKLRQNLKSTKDNLCLQRFIDEHRSNSSAEHLKG